MADPIEPGIVKSVIPAASQEEQGHEDQDHDDGDGAPLYEARETRPTAHMARRVELGSVDRLLACHDRLQK
jgi:hypothetical protein